VAWPALISPSLSDGELLLRLGLTLVLCGLIGLEREARDQIAGLRTHILVGLGAALFTLISAYGFEDFFGRGTTGVTHDPSRIAAQVVSGIGFLGAGAIIRQGFSVRGVTTAAALWIAAAVGMACGAGLYVGAGATTAIVLAALIALRPSLLGRWRSDFVVLDVELRPGAHPGEALAALERNEVRLQGISTERRRDGQRLQVEMMRQRGQDLHALLAELCSLDDVVGVRSTGAANGGGG